MFVWLVAGVSAADLNESDIVVAAAERAAFGLPADRATIEEILRSGADLGTQKWGIVLTASEEIELDIEGRAKFANDVSDGALAYAKSLPTYGGAYVDQTDNGGIVISLTERNAVAESRISALAPSGDRSATVRIVEHTFAELAAAAERVRALWREMSSVELLGVGVDEVANGLKLRVVAADVDSSLVAARDLSAYLGVSVTVVAAEPSEDATCTARHNCYDPFKSGTKIDNDTPHGDDWVHEDISCTMGFHVRLQNGDEQFLTAGHCGAGAVSDWWHPGTGTSEQLAFAATMFPDVNRDIMRINIVNNSQAS